MKTQTVTASLLKVLSIAAFIAVGLTLEAHADGSYTVNVSREQGNIACDISSADGGSVSCQADISAEASLAITMNPVPNSTGFYGVDKVLEGNSDLVLVAVADANQTPKALVLVQKLNSSAQGFDGSMALVESNSLTAININPIHVDKTDAQSVKVQMSFVAYAPAKDGAQTMSALDKQKLTDVIMKKVQPVVLSLSQQ